MSINDILSYLLSIKFILSVVMIAIAVVFLFILKKIKKKRFPKSNDQHASMYRYVYTIIKGTIIFIAVMMVFHINGINVTSLVAGFGIASAVIGLAVQDILKDVIMGAHIVSDKFFKIGDIVKIGDVEGKIIDFNLRTTKIKSAADESIVSVCNRDIDFAKTNADVWYIDVPVPYEQDPQYVESVLKNTCDLIKNEKSVADCTLCGIQEFADSAVLYRIYIKVAVVSDKWAVRRNALGVIRKELIKADISIPYTQIDIHSN